MHPSVSLIHRPLPQCGPAAGADALPACIPSAWRLLVQQCRAQQPELRPTVPGLLAQLHHLLALIPTPPAPISTPAVNSTSQTLTACVPPTPFPTASLRRTQSARYAEVATDKDSALVAGNWEAMPSAPQCFGVFLHNSSSTSCIEFLSEKEASFDAAEWGIAAVGAAANSISLQKEDSRSSTDFLLEEESYDIAPSRALLAAGGLSSAPAPLSAQEFSSVLLH